MKYKVDGWNNFCWVFELPEVYPTDYCFGGGHSVSFQLVDWFYPVPNVSQAGVSKEEWEKKLGSFPAKEIALSELEETLIPFLQKKRYMKPDRQYLILYKFGGSTVFEASLNSNPANPARSA